MRQIFVATKVQPQIITVNSSKALARIMLKSFCCHFSIKYQPLKSSINIAYGTWLIKFIACCGLFGPGGCRPQKRSDARDYRKQDDKLCLTSGKNAPLFYNRERFIYVIAATSIPPAENTAPREAETSQKGGRSGKDLRTRFSLPVKHCEDLLIYDEEEE